MKMNKMIAILVVAIFMGSCVGIGNVSGSTPLIIDGDKITLHGSGDHFVHILVPNSYGYRTVILEGESDPGMHSLWREVASRDIRQLKGTATVIYTPKTHEKLFVSPGEHISLIVGGHSPSTVTKMWAHSPGGEPKPTSTPKSTSKPTSKSNIEYDVLSQKNADVYLFNEDNDLLEVELYINGGYEGEYHVLSGEWGDCGSFKLPNDLHNEYVARWYEPDTNRYYEKRVEDQGRYWVKITLPAHDEEQVKPASEIYTPPSRSDHERVKESNVLDEWIDQSFDDFDVPMSRELYELGDEMLTKLDIPRKDAEDIIDIAFTAHKEMEGYNVVEIATVLAYNYEGDISEVRKTASELVEASSHKRTVPEPEPVPEEVTTKDLRIDEPPARQPFIKIQVPESMIVPNKETLQSDICFECAGSYYKSIPVRCHFSVEDPSIATIDGLGKDQFFGFVTDCTEGSHWPLTIRGRKEGITKVTVTATDQYECVSSEEIEVRVTPEFTEEELAIQQRKWDEDAARDKEKLTSKLGPVQRFMDILCGIIDFISGK